MSDTVRVRLIGLVMVGVLVGLFAVAAALYAQVFVPRVPVTLVTDRSGLIMDPGNRVTLRGVEVGQVTGVEQVGRGAVLTLGLDPDQIDRIPANVLAEITPTTVFGAKYVVLAEPDGSAAAALSPGAVIYADRVTVEVNNVFQRLAVVLRTVDAAKLNATLGELSRALEGRGSRIAGLADSAEAYLARLNTQLPTVRRDLQELAGVTDVYADIAPDVVTILDNTTVTGRTIVEEADELDGFLLDVTALADTGQELLAENRQNLVTALDLLRPTTSLLRRYDPVLTCFVLGLDETRQILEPAVGGATPEVRLDSTLTLGEQPYRNPEDLPVLETDAGPDCGGLPLLEPGERPAQVDTGTGWSREPDNSLQVGDAPFAPLLGLPGGVGEP